MKKFIFSYNEFGTDYQINYLLHDINKDGLEDIKDFQSFCKIIPQIIKFINKNKHCFEFKGKYSIELKDDGDWLDKEEPFYNKELKVKTFYNFTKPLNKPTVVKRSSIK